MMLTREDKERQVIKLYDEGKTIREIAKLVHMSFGDISAIRRKYTGEDKIKEEKSLSKNILALKLFHEGKTPTEAAIILDMSPLEIVKIHEDYLELNNYYIFFLTYKKIRDNFQSFMNLYNIMYENGFGEKQVFKFVKLANHIYELNEYDKSIS